jgi:hypothetical protein
MITDDGFVRYDIFVSRYMESVSRKRQAKGSKMGQRNISPSARRPPVQGDRIPQRIGRPPRVKDPARRLNPPPPAATGKGLMTVDCQMVIYAPRHVIPACWSDRLEPLNAGGRGHYQ